MSDKIPPLNGQRTHPLSDHAKGRLRELLTGPVPAMQFNPGVVNRLQRGGLADLIQLPSPFRTHHGRRVRGNVDKIAHLILTDAGRAYLAEIDGEGDSRPLE